MAIEKYRSVMDMNAALVRVRTADGFERFLRHCARYLRIAPRNYPRGVFKFKTIEAAQAARERVAREAHGRLGE